MGTSASYSELGRRDWFTQCGGQVIGANELEVCAHMNVVKFKAITQPQPALHAHALTLVRTQNGVKSSIDVGDPQQSADPRKVAAAMEKGAAMSTPHNNSVQVYPQGRQCSSSSLSDTQIHFGRPAAPRL